MDPPWAVFGQRRLVGGVLGTRFFATRRSDRLQRNSTGPVLTARVEPDKDGSAIYCSFRPQLFMIVVAIWAVFALLFGGGAWISSVGKLISGDFSANSWLEFSFPLGFLAFASLFIFLYRQQFSADRAFLISSVRRAVDPEAGVVLYE